MTSTTVLSPQMRTTLAAISANVPVLFKGDPGEGKTGRITRLAQQLGRHLEVVITATREAPDFLGIQVEMDEGYIGYKPMRWVHALNEAPGGLLFLDEINRGARETMNAALRTVQERQVGDTWLKPTVSIVAAMNGIESNPEVEELNSAMSNRFMHLDWEFDEEEWLDNIGTNFEFVAVPEIDQVLSRNPKARRIVVAGYVSTYHRHRRGKLHPGVPKDPVQASGAWPSPRSWSNLIDVMAYLPPDDGEAMLIAAKGLIGEGAALDFTAWLDTADLLDPMAVMNDPGLVDWRNTRPDRLFALLQSIESVGLTSPKWWRRAALALTACADGGKPDVAMPYAQRVLSRVPKGEKIPAEAVDAFQELLSRTKYKIAVPAAL